jgi:hypothetical protein
MPIENCGGSVGKERNRGGLALGAHAEERGGGVPGLVPGGVCRRWGPDSDATEVGVVGVCGGGGPIWGASMWGDPGREGSGLGPEETVIIIFKIWIFKLMPNYFIPKVVFLG